MRNAVAAMQLNNVVYNLLYVYITSTFTQRFATTILLIVQWVQLALWHTIIAPMSKSIAIACPVGLAHIFQMKKQVTYFMNFSFFRSEILRQIL